VADEPKNFIKTNSSGSLVSSLTNPSNHHSDEKRREVGKSPYVAPTLSDPASEMQRLAKQELVKLKDYQLKQDGIEGLL